MQAFVSVNWLLSEEHIDLETELAWGFLDYLMLGTTAAPLRRALTESGLGESIIGGGLSDELRQPTFSLGLKGVDPANAQKVCLLPATPLSCLLIFLCDSGAADESSDSSVCRHMPAHTYTPKALFCLLLACLLPLWPACCLHMACLQPRWLHAIETRPEPQLLQCWHTLICHLPIAALVAVEYMTAWHMHRSRTWC